MSAVQRPEATAAVGETGGVDAADAAGTVRRSVADAWNDAAGGWHGHRESIRSWLREPTKRMLDLAHVGAGGKVLDVAAGAGDQTRDIASRVGANGMICVTDVSPRILELARSEFPGAAGPRLEFVVADAENLSAAGSGFDAAVCRLGLMFCADPVTALSSMLGSLRVGGRVGGVVFSQPEANPSVAIPMRLAARHAGRSPPDPRAPGALFSLCDPPRLRAMIEAAGFVDVEIEVVAAGFGARSCADYVEFIRTSGSPIIEMLRGLPAPQQSDAWRDIERALNVYSGAGGWESPTELLVFGATRAR